MEKWLKSFLPLPCLVVIAACIYIYITHHPPIPPQNYIPQDRTALETLRAVVELGYPLVGAVLIVWLIFNPFTLRRSIRNFRRLKEGSGDQPPRDGSIIALVGPITADHKPVITPAGRTSCIAYYYKLQSYGGIRSEELNFYGYAFTPSSINTSFGRVRILAVPHIDIFYKTWKTYYQKDSEALNNFKNYLRNTEFAESIIGSLPFVKEFNMSMTDRERPIKRDVWIKFSRRDPDKYTITEHCIDEGECVCAFGMYSASHQGLVPNPEAGDPYSIQIKCGPIIKFIREERSSIVRNLAAILCSLIMLPAMVWTYQNFYYAFNALYNFIIMTK